MKKFSILNHTFTKVLAGLLCITFFSCENFLNGGNLKDQLDFNIDYLLAKNISVQVFPIEGTGSTDPAGTRSVKLGYSFPITFSEASDWSFIKWIAVSSTENFDKDNYKEVEGVVFDDAYSLKTNAKITVDSNDIRIIPLCSDRLAVVKASPEYSTLGVSRDRSISVSFTKEPAKSSFIFEENEIPSGAVTKKDENGNIWAYIFENQTYFKNITITNADDFSIADHFTKPQLEGKLLTIAVDKTNPITLNAGEVFKTVKVTLSKDITDTSNIKMNTVKSWNYQVTNTTDEKATITISSTAVEGSVNLSGTKDYSIDQKITLSFTESADYQFIKWDYDSEVIYIEDPSSVNTTATVLEKTAEENPTQIKAVCAPRLRVTTFAPVNDSLNPSVSKNSSIIITFNKDIPSEQENLEQLNKISIAIGGTPILSSFLTPVVNANTITFVADNSNMLDVPSGQKKTVSVMIPADFYYLLEDGTKVTYGGNGISFDYKIDETTLDKAEVTFSSPANSGTFTSASGTNNYSIGQEVAIAFEPQTGWKFNGWTVTCGSEEVPESKIKIEDKNALSTKMIIYEAVPGVTVTANASIVPVIQSIKVNNQRDIYSTTSNLSYSKIYIDFNKEMDTSSVDLSRYGSINITNAAVSTQHYEEYYKPEWSEDSKQLILIPLSSIKDKVPEVSDTLDLVIKLNANNQTIKDTLGNDLEINSVIHYSFEIPYTINGEKETVKPVFLSFDLVFFTSDDNHRMLSDSPFDEWTSETFEQNYIKDTLFFVMAGYDEHSGLKSFRVTETHIKTPSGSSGTGEKIITDFEDINSWFYAYHTLKTVNDGIIKLDCQFIDNAGNESDAKTYYVLKDTTINMNSFKTVESKKLTLDYHRLQTEKIPLTMEADNFVNIKKIHDNADFDKYKVPENSTTRTETLTFNYDTVNDKAYDNYINTKISLTVKYGYSKNSLTQLNISEQTSDYEKYTFTRDLTQNCIIEITATDILGNSRTEYRVFPCQISIIGNWRSNANDNIGNYEMFNITDSSITPLPNLYPGMKIIYYTVSPNYHIYNGSNAEKSWTAPRFYKDLRYYNRDQSSDPYFVGRINIPNGKYPIYVLPVFLFDDDEFYYGTVASGYVYHNVSLETNSPDITLPASTSDWSINYDQPLIKSAGTLTAHIGFNNQFTSNPNSEYGVKYNKDNEKDMLGSIKYNYDGLDFKLETGHKYTIYLFEKNQSNEINLTSNYKVFDITTEDCDNNPPVTLIQKFKPENKSDQYLKYPDINKLYFNTQLMPTDLFGLKQAEGYSSDYVEFEYCFTEEGAYGIAQNLTASDLQNRQLQKSIFKRDSNTALIEYNSFDSFEKNYLLTLKFEDSNGNISVENLHIKRENLFEKNIMNLIAITGTDKSKFFNKTETVIAGNPGGPDGFRVYFTQTGLGYSFVSYGLKDDEWNYYAIDSNLQYQDSLTSSPLVEDSGTLKTRDKVVLPESLFLSLQLGKTQSGSVWQSDYRSDIIYICPDWEIKRNQGGNALDGVCQDKAIIPGLGGSYQVYSDAPCFAHTMVYPTNKLDYLEQLKNEHPAVLTDDYKVWEAVGKEYGLKILNNDFSTKTSYYYTPFDKIPAGFSYVTVFHFADRTAVMTEVKQK